MNTLVRKFLEKVAKIKQYSVKKFMDPYPGLDYHQRLIVSSFAVSTDCRCPSGDWYTTLRSHHSGVEGPLLAASPAAHTLKNGDAGAQVPK